jgi:hypothetical protein
MKITEGEAGLLFLIIMTVIGMIIITLMPDEPDYRTEAQIKADYAKEQALRFEDSVY